MARRNAVHQVDVDELIKDGVGINSWCSGGARNGRRKGISIVIEFGPMDVPLVRFNVSMRNEAGDVEIVKSFSGTSLREIVDFYNDL